MGWGLIISMFLYMAGLMAAFTSTGIADLDGSRQYSPLFFPMTLLFLLMINQVVQEKWQGRNLIFARAAAGLVLLGALIAPIQWWSNTLATPLVNTDQAFSIYAYWDHPAIAQLQNLPASLDQQPLISNCKKCLYFAGNKPAVEFYVAPLLKAKKPPFVIVWFKDLVDSGHFSTTEAGLKTWLDQVQGPGLDLVTISQSPRGALYEVEVK
jgi:hypothetical protein